MKRASLAAMAVLLVGVAVGAGAAGLGGEILDPAINAISENMPDEAKETSGVLDVLEGVAGKLDEILADVPAELPEDAGIPQDVPPEETAIPEEIPPEQAEFPELPAEAEESLDLANGYLDSYAP